MQSLQTTSSSTMQCEKYESSEITAKHSPSKYSLDFLTNQETSRIDHAIVEFKKPKYLHECNSNILKTLQKLPDELTKKVVVVIATHGGNGIITYFKKSYNHHVFIMGKTEDGLRIFDPQIPHSTSIKSSQWVNEVYEEVPIKHTLTNSCTLRSLPQFRLVDGLTYLENYEESCEFDTLNPDYAISENSSILKSQLWRKSFSLNLYEVTKLFTGVDSYEDAVLNHRDNESPLKRLEAQHIAYLREIFVNS
ncbi:hypothetical protein J7438_15600 [Thalassotalea sp. G20_0]|uniref:hypothetical protein n=1 Tax=Thalassotalea sp. G20_0 TaxID=2821093 RepID=UPI001ADAFA66|nr:hypothetical protein [Thalassotalea sp. G20_0]MBO9495503.1 hypothetical protein [Thalassotalea sp. G20_0]